MDQYPDDTCRKCGSKLKRRTIKSRFALKLGYLQEYRTPCKACDNPECSNYHILLHVDNPDIAPHHHLTYAVQSEIVRARFADRETGKEILQDLSIKTTEMTIGDMIRTYEFGCDSLWDPMKIEEIKKRGYLFLHVDVIEPMKGKHGILSVHESFAKIALGAMILYDKSNQGYADFFTVLKSKLQLVFGVPIKGVMSDALPAQRIAIEHEFRDCLHCICHYHFLDYVMLDALAADEHVITQIRSYLHKLRDLQSYKKLRAQKKEMPFPYRVWHLYLEELLPCMDWKPKKEDPCFSSIRLLDMVTGIGDRLHRDCTALLYEEIRVDKNTRTAIHRIEKVVTAIKQDFSATGQELVAIHDHVEELSRILNDHEATMGTGLKRMEMFCLENSTRQHDSQCRALEKGFLKQVHDYYLTKGLQLFNYRQIPDAPATNNYQESRYHLLKHFIRRTIGQHSAKEYLARHGARLLFVNTDAKVEEIEAILKGMDQTEARKVLEKERPSRNGIESLMHKEHAWVILNPQFEKLTEILKEQTKRYGEVIMSPREFLEEEAKNGKDISEYFLL